MSFEGKVLFATGGGSGIAAATARRFAAGGGRVAVVDLDAAGARRSPPSSTARSGSPPTSPTRSRCAPRCDAAGELGRIDCVLNAAGHAEFGPIEEWTLERWNRMMAVHAGGTFLVCKHVAADDARAGRRLDRQHRLDRGADRQPAQRAVRRGQGRDHRPSPGSWPGRSRPDVRVNVVAPGRMRTGMTEPLIAQRGGGGRGGRQGVRPGQPAAAGRRARGDRRADLLPAVRRRQLHHRHAARRRRRRDGDLSASWTEDLMSHERVAHLADLQPETAPLGDVPGTRRTPMPSRTSSRPTRCYADAGRPGRGGAALHRGRGVGRQRLGYGTAEGPEAIGAIVAGHFRPGRADDARPRSAAADRRGPRRGPRRVLVPGHQVDRGTTGPLIHFYYDDVVRRVDDGRWRFARRRPAPGLPSDDRR